MLVSRGDDVLLRLPAPEGSHLTLAYTHSIYDVPVREVYRLTSDQGLVLESAAASEAALEYSALWPSGVETDGTPFAALDRVIGELILSVDSVGRPALTVGALTVDLGALLGSQGSVSVGFRQQPRAVVRLDSIFSAQDLIAENVETGAGLWQSPVVRGEIFTLSYSIPTFNEQVREQFAVGPDGQLVLVSGTYGSGAMAADCSIQCDRTSRYYQTVQPERAMPELVLRLPAASASNVNHRGSSLPLSSGDDAAVRLRTVAWPAAWFR